MRPIPPSLIVALSVLAAPALTQTLGSLPPATNPQPGAPPGRPPSDATPGTYLEAARLNIGQGRLNDASVALEEAETRILTRSVVRSAQVEASNQPLIVTINQARGALAANDKAGALAKIDEALRSPALNGPTQ